MAAMAATVRISNILIKRKVIEPDVLATAEEDARTLGIRLEKYLVDRRLVRSADMTLALAEYLNMPPIRLSRFTPDAALLESIPKEMLTKHFLIPIVRTGRNMTVAMGDPFDILALDELHDVTGAEITPLVSNEQDVLEVLNRVLHEDGTGLNMEEIMKGSDSDVEVGREEREEMSLEQMLESAEGAPVIRMVNMILVEALRTRASDIHIEPQDKNLRLRYRVDGVLIERPNPPKSLQAAITSRVKIMADLDIAERRIPQDGRFKIRALGKEVDIRVSLLPTVHGEKVVMRVLDKGSLYPNLAGLGLDDQAFKALSYAVAQPHGIILVTGPTGSGKTTTLYSCLQELNQADVNIVTCEDPVEYQLEGVNQVQVNSDVGLTFAAALRSILRQDPDIVLVGEIRDGDTAEIAVKAALTGHLVLSTLHTNDASGAIARLMDMGVQPFLLGSSLILAQAQRLYRKLCVACRKEAEVPQAVLATNRIDPEVLKGATVYKAIGCPRCNNIGYKGRGAIMEVLPVDEEIRALILQGASSTAVKAKAEANGMVTLKMAGLMRVREGITSIEQALEVTGGE